MYIWIYHSENGNRGNLVVTHSVTQSVLRKVGVAVNCIFFSGHQGSVPMHRPIDCRGWVTVKIVFSSLVTRVRFPCTGLLSAEIEVLLQLNISTYNPLHNETSLNFRRNKICLKREWLQSEKHFPHPLNTSTNWNAECKHLSFANLQQIFHSKAVNLQRLHSSYCRQNRHPAQLMKGS